MIKKILTIPFFIGLAIIPLGILLWITRISKVQELLFDYGEWAFKQWENDERH